MKLNARGHVIQESPAVLTPQAGRWRPHGATQVWEPWEHGDPIPEADPLAEKVAETAALIACPVCHATLPQRCTRRNGKPATTPHDGRLVPRVCQCGSSLPSPTADYCTPCQFAEDTKVVERLVAGELGVKSTRPQRLRAINQWVALGGDATAFCHLNGWRPERYIDKEV